MAAKQSKPSTSWAISAGATIGKSKGSLGASLVLLTLFDVDSQIFIPLTLKGGSVGGGLNAGLTLSTFSPYFFSTSKPLWAKAFEGKTSIATAELTVGIGGGLSYLTFWGVDHDPYWLDIGGLEVGLSAGVGAGIWHCIVNVDAAYPNNGCLIAPGGDPLCGGSSKSQPTQSTPTYQSGG